MRARACASVALGSHKHHCVCVYFFKEAVLFDVFQQREDICMCVRACARTCAPPGSTAPALKSSGLSTAPLLPVCQARGYCRQVRGVSSPSVHPFGKFSKSKPVLEGTRSPRTLPRLSPPTDAFAAIRELYSPEKCPLKE